MLKSLRSNTKTIIWITVGIFILCYVIGSAVSLKDQKGSHVAKVFNKKISRQEYQMFYDIIFYSPRIQGLLRQNTNVPEGLIMTTALQYIALYYEAKSRGIKVTDNDVKEEIRRRFSFQGIFNPKIYERHVHNVMRRDLRFYEETVRKELIINTLLTSLRESAAVSPEEVKKAFDLDNKQFIIKYLTINQKDFENQIPLIEETLKTFYDENKHFFNVDEKYDFAYLHFKAEAYMKEVFISNYKIEEYYQNNLDQFTNSEDNAPLPLEEVRSEIEQILQTNEVRLILNEKAIEAQNRIKELRDVAKGAQEFGIHPQKTGFKTSNELQNIFGWAPNFYDRLASIPPKAIRVIQTDKGAFVLVLSEKEYAYTPPYPEVVNKVKEKYMSISSQKRAQEKALELYDRIISGSITFEEIVTEEGLDIKELGPFSATTPIASSEFNPIQKLVATLINYEKGNMVPPYPLDKEIALIQVADTIEAEEEFFEKNKPIYEEKLHALKGNQILNFEVGLILKEANIQNYLIARDDPFADIQ
ncbi:SurA N-terminal domain-containing protein [Candidatus Omnitrophota bacterium]